MTHSPGHNARTPDRPLILIGAGGHARVLLDAVRLLGCTVTCIADRDPARHGEQIDGIMVRGYEAIEQADPREALLVNAVGSVARPIARREVFEHFKKQGHTFATLIHPSAVVADTVAIGEGAQVMAGAVVQPHAVIGANVLVNTRASIDHDCRIDDHVHIAPGVTLSGNVAIGPRTHVGVGATVIQGVCIGADALVGAGAVVIGDIEDGATAVGVPARVRQTITDEPAH